MSVFEALAQSLKPPKVEMYTEVTWCRHCLQYRNNSGEKIESYQVANGAKMTNRFCNAECHREYNKEFLTPSRNN